MTRVVEYLFIRGERRNSQVARPVHDGFSSPAVSAATSVARRNRALKQLLERDIEIVDQSPQVGQQVRA